jgi:hypothetical protein
MPAAAHRPDLSNAVWRASSYSNAQGGECLQLADTLPAVRDSKNPTGPALLFPARAWSGFLAALTSRDLA